jgi:hypothetical protein
MECGEVLINRASFRREADPVGDVSQTVRAGLRVFMKNAPSLSTTQDARISFEGEVSHAAAPGRASEPLGSGSDRIAPINPT